MNSSDLHDDYSHLTPDTVISAVESLGLLCDARIFPLNSYENRVYQVGIEDADPLIAKFYRPNRWSDAAILEEHVFTQQLMALELPVVPPLLIAPPLSTEGTTLHRFEGYRFALYRRQGGQALEADDFDQLFRLGRLLGRLHRVSQTSLFQSRPTLSVHRMIREPADFILQSGFLPSSVQANYGTLINTLEQRCQEALEKMNPTFLRCHGDCHIGNILWHRESGPWLVDFDDCLNAPAIQDLWMLLSGNRHEQQAQLSELLEGYEEFHDFDRRELHLIEPLRTLRMVHYAGWLARRWDDPAFPASFPWFNTEHYWQHHLGSLQEQLLLLDAEPFQLH